MGAMPMRSRFLSLVIGLSLSSTGCGIVKYTALNTVVIPSRLVNQCRARCTEREAADNAWKQVCQASPPGQYSKAYGQGFKRGFVEYLDANGDGQPPGAPPLCYRFLKHENADGTQAIRDWYSGYNHGTRVAQDSGIRSWIIIPPSDMLLTSVVAPVGGGGRDSAADAQTLPPPRKQLSVPMEPAKDDQAPSGPNSAPRPAPNGTQQP